MMYVLNTSLGHQILIPVKSAENLHCLPSADWHCQCQLVPTIDRKNKSVNFTSVSTPEMKN